MPTLIGYEEPLAASAMHAGVKYHLHRLAWEARGEGGDLPSILIQDWPSTAVHLNLILIENFGRGHAKHQDKSAIEVRSYALIHNSKTYDTFYCATNFIAYTL